MDKAKQFVNDVMIFTRHSAGCRHKNDRNHLGCNCRKWLQAQVNGEQVRKPAGCRSYAQALESARAWDRELRGEVEETPITIEQAVKDWLNFREANDMNGDKPKLMGRKLVEWCAENSIVRLHDLTSAKVVNFRSSLKYKTTTSGSLKVHWSVIGGFFGWATGMGHFKKNPVPNTRLHPQFKIKFRKPPVVIPKAEDVARVLATAEGMDRIFVSTMRYSGMAIRDTALLSRTKLKGALIRGERSKTKESYRVRIPQWLADALLSLPCEEFFFWNGVNKPSSVAHHWKKRLTPIFKTAKVRMTSHGFRHYFISEQLGFGRSYADVAQMVGTSESEIRKTYAHETDEGAARLDKEQSQSFLQMGLDAQGNELDKHEKGGTTRRVQ